MNSELKNAEDDLDQACNVMLDYCAGQALMAECIRLNTIEEDADFLSEVREEILVRGE